MDAPSSDADLEGPAGAGSGAPGHGVVVTLLYFAQARQAAGTAREIGHAESLAELIGDAERRHGPGFADIVAISRIWRNGEPTDGAVMLSDGDEVAVLPPVSGGS